MFENYTVIQIAEKRSVLFFCNIIHDVLNSRAVKRVVVAMTVGCISNATAVSLNLLKRHRNSETYCFCLKINRFHCRRIRGINSNSLRPLL